MCFPVECINQHYGSATRNVKSYLRVRKMDNLFWGSTQLQVNLYTATFTLKTITLKITLTIFCTLKNTEITLKDIYKGNHINNHTEIISFLFKDCEGH